MTDSPCIKLCRIDPVSDLCLGCWRRLDEIAAWGTMTPEARRAVMAELPARMADPANAPKDQTIRRRAISTV
ncbi:DUF1289 domain-containing protein [Paracoccus nototheniae]|uniref:DUF1289 domain-containing protein n=1 Tax=Paracoccus nototheniae TaxID=2489002 RepID=UPI001039184B|nr:DUF1289 domain-containing protein [Paracoccus nototheniae]